MGYSSGMLNKRVTIQNSKQLEPGTFGLGSGGVKWEDVCVVDAAVDYAKGIRGMQEGSLDVYAVKLVRMRWNPAINERSRIVYDGRIYEVLGDTFHADYQANTIQFNAQLVIGETPQQSSSSLGMGNVTAEQEIG